MVLDRAVLVIISTVGLILNCLTLFITGRSLQLNDIDMILMVIISISDITRSLSNIVRVIALEAKWLNPLETNTTWCIIDSSLIMAYSQVAIETVAILGCLRYSTICLNKRKYSNFWYIMVALSFITSISLNLGNSLFPNVYLWSTSELFCLPQTNETATNLYYFTTWSIIRGIRIFSALCIITFCYYKVSIAYRKILEERIISIELGEEQENSQNQIDSSRLSDNVPNKSSHIQIQSQRRLISIHLLGTVLLYIICVAPIGLIIIRKITSSVPPSPSLVTLSQLFYLNTVIINPLFVLISHEPSRRELLKIVYNLFNFKSTKDTLGSFPYQQY